LKSLTSKLVEYSQMVGNLEHDRKLPVWSVLGLTWLVFLTDRQPRIPKVGNEPSRI
jgi:hypothetical protein